MDQLVSMSWTQSRPTDAELSRAASLGYEREQRAGRNAGAPTGSGRRARFVERWHALTHTGLHRHGAAGAH
ncbi:hypothetical protein [Demequina salsinemoris]|uniref:hypothetical protein n=1 Tax=Demequina salsinemoris TaxID=577470 RepID=UPI000783C06A|nr:hypothetical protein [Demequina salsinemoris]